MLIPLLSTKFHIPTARPGLVRRPRLITELDEGLQGKMILVSAPPGFGKSTLLSEWIRNGHHPACWLSLDEQDNDPIRFLTYLIGALQTVKEDIGANTKALLQSPSLPQIESILTTLINECDYALAAGSLTNRHLILVLDDYHLITNPAVNEIVTFLLSYLPRQIQIVIATRDDPDLPLARLRIQGELTELRAADLRFTNQEITDFFMNSFGVEMTAEDLSALAYRTEGWIAGLQVAALSMRGRNDHSSFLGAFTGSNRYIFDYLGEEVLDKLPVDDQRFLLKTAILTRMCGSLCDQVTGQANSQTTLERLERSNLFLINLDDTRHWYRYHHLFADFLQTHLEKTHPEMAAELHRKAAQWLEMNDLPDEAFMHLIAAQDYQGAGHLVEKSATNMALRGETETLQRWLDTLPKTMLSESPRLCLAQAWAYLYAAPYELTDSWLQKAEALIESNRFTNDPIRKDSHKAERSELLGEINTLRARMASAVGDTERTIELGQQALEYLPEVEIDLRAANMMAVGYAHRYKGNLDLAKRAFLEATNLSKETGNLFQELDGLCNLSNLQMGAGELQLAQETAEGALQIASQSKETPSSILGEVYLVLGVLLYERNDLVEAKKHLNRSIDLSKQGNMTELLYAAYLWLSQVNRAKGHIAQAKNDMQLSMDFAQRTNNWRVITHANAAQARFFIHCDDLASAEVWAGNYETRNEAHPVNLPLLHEYEVLTLARIYFAQGRYNKALKILMPHLTLAQDKGRYFHFYSMMILLILAKEASGDASGSMDALKQLLSYTENEGFIRLYLDGGQRMANILRRASNDGIAPSYIQKLLNEFSYEPDMVPIITSEGTLKPLSRRELQVLNLVSNGLSNREIAEELFITVGTTKRHLVNIFRKLGVSNRMQAVAKARELELIN